MVDTKDLPQTILMLVFIGILIGAGALVLSSFSDAARTTRSVADSEVLCNFGVPCTMASIPVVPNTIVVRNRTVTVPTTSYQFNAVTGVLNLTDTTYNQSNDVKFNTTYNYYETSSATTGLTNSLTALATIPSTWLPLIITVFALAVIIGLIIKSFYMKTR